VTAGRKCRRGLQAGRADLGSLSRLVLAPWAAWEPWGSAARCLLVSWDVLPFFPDAPAATFLTSCCSVQYFTFFFNFRFHRAGLETLPALVSRAMRPDLHMTIDDVGAIPDVFSDLTSLPIWGATRPKPLPTSPFLVRGILIPSAVWCYDGQTAPFWLNATRASLVFANLKRTDVHPANDHGTLNVNSNSMHDLSRISFCIL
jgi:hypothetical protein